MKYDVIIIGAGPGGIFSAYELTKQAPDLKVAVFEAGHELKRRKCPIDGTKIKSCVGCDSCSIMSGFGGGGGFFFGNLAVQVHFPMESTILQMTLAEVCMSTSARTRP